MKNKNKNLLDQLKSIPELNKAYIVGGWLRDMLLKRVNKDIDIAIAANPYTVAKKVSNVLGGRLVALDEKNKIYRVAFKNNPEVEFLDFAKFKGPDILSDLKKRDFTINSFAVPLNSPIEVVSIIDPFGGLKDLKKHVIRMTTPNAFNDDPLRLLRAFRFACQLNFTIEPKTKKLIKKRCILIKKSAPERIRDEIFKILQCKSASTWFEHLDKAGLLNIIIPEIISMKRSARRFYFHPLGLWQHAMETLSGLEEILNSLPRLFGSYSERINKHLDQPLSSGVDRRSMLKLVALLHDIAKPICAKRIKNKMRFLEHEAKGAEIASSILKRLRLGRNDIKISKALIEHHMRPINLGQTPVITERAIYRLFRDIGQNTPDLMLLTLADCYSYRRLKTKKTVSLKRQKKVVNKLILRYFDEQERMPEPKIIDGHMIMKKFKLKPGPVIGQLLKAAAEAQALGRIKSSEQALELIFKKLTQLKKRNIII